MDEPVQRGPASKDLKALDVSTGSLPTGLGANFAADYLQTYYCGDVTPDEKIVLSFLVEVWREVGAVDVFIDVGCGPTVHHLFPAAPYASRLRAFDFVPECVSEVSRWRERTPPVHNWGPWVAATLESEGGQVTASAIAKREDQVRAKLEMIDRCDLRSESPLPAPGRFPVVGCFYTTEQAAMVQASWSSEQRLQAWRGVFQNLVTLVAPKGWLLMASVGYTDHYVTYEVGSGTPLAHPLPFLTERSYEDALRGFGFDMRTAKILRVPVAGQESEGVTDVLLVAARLKS